MADDDLQSKIEALEAKRAARRDGVAKARQEQYAKDLEQIDALEEQHGPDRVTVLEMPSFMPGLPTVVVVKTPEPNVFTRFRQMVRKASKDVEAMGNAKDLLAASCIAYPDADTYARMKTAWPSIHDNAGLAAIQLGESEGKE